MQIIPDLLNKAIKYLLASQNSTNDFEFLIDAIPLAQINLEVNTTIEEYEFPENLLKAIEKTIYKFQSLYSHDLINSIDKYGDTPWTYFGKQHEEPINISYIDALDQLNKFNEQVKAQPEYALKYKIVLCNILNNKKFNKVNSDNIEINNGKIYIDENYIDSYLSILLKTTVKDLIIPNSPILNHTPEKFDSAFKNALDYLNLLMCKNNSITANGLISALQGDQYKQLMTSYLPDQIETLKISQKFPWFSGLQNKKLAIKELDEKTQVCIRDVRGILGIDGVREEDLLCTYMIKVNLEGQEIQVSYKEALECQVIFQQEIDNHPYYYKFLKTAITLAAQKKGIYVNEQVVNEMCSTIGGYSDNGALSESILNLKSLRYIFDKELKYLMHNNERCDDIEKIRILVEKDQYPKLEIPLPYNQYLYSKLYKFFIKNISLEDANALKENAASWKKNIEQVTDLCDVAQKVLVDNNYCAEIDPNAYFYRCEHDKIDVSIKGKIVNISQQEAIDFLTKLYELEKKHILHKKFLKASVIDIILESEIDAIEPEINDYVKTRLLGDENFKEVELDLNY